MSIYLMALGVREETSEVRDALEPVLKEMGIDAFPNDLCLADRDAFAGPWRIHHESIQTAGRGSQRGMFIDIDLTKLPLGVEKLELRLS